MGDELRRAGRPGPRPPLYALCRDAERRRLEDGQRRHDLRAGLRRPAQALDRRRRRGPVRSRTSSGSARARPTAPGRSNSGDGVWKSVDAGQDLDEHGPRGFAPHRPGRHPSDEPRRRLRRGHGTSVLRRTPSAASSRRPTAGKTWKKVLYVDDEDRRRRSDPGRVGARHALRGDVREGPAALDTTSLGGPGAPSTRRPTAAGPGRGSAGGLPTGRIGRIGLDVYQKDPNVLYAVVENVNPRPATPQEIETGQAPRRRAGAAHGRQRGLSAPTTAAQTWRKVNAGYEAALDKAPYSFNQLRVDPADPETVYITGQSLASTNDGGKTWKGLGWPSDGVMPRAFGDWRTMWIDPLDPNRLIFGSRRRRQHLLRPGQDEPSRLQPAADGVVRRGRRHGGPVQHLRRPPGPRLVEGPVERLGRRDHAQPTG
ncbi:MAG: hypothetical protein M0C28_12880 [Candidatus Moduliflexus flocculans]|nr:hypothetical protein [Candidatus Moduliflexus flocculans]